MRARFRYGYCGGIRSRDCRSRICRLITGGARWLIIAGMSRVRWWILSLLFFATTINYLDRIVFSEQVQEEWANSSMYEQLKQGVGFENPIVEQQVEFSSL